MVNDTFENLLNELAKKRPNKKIDSLTYFYFKDHPVFLQSGEMEGIHWMDIYIELPRFRADNINTCRKLLQSNREMATATPIPTWFAAGEKGEVLFVNRLDWQHVSADVLDDHILRCIDQMSEALMSEGA